TRERATHRALDEAHRNLATLNRTLEDRVEAQVAEITALSRLRRFLSTPVADAVLSAESDALLEPHRREIAVFFCDLRGFTKFAASAQPEEVHAVLTAYFDLLGEMVGRYEATVGGFTGDGLMAFFNDPLPVEEPALRAVAMAVELRDPMEHLIAEWQRQGYVLGYGVGIAFGYANIETIGFEGRRDYTALGPVVNLAARLCAEATSGEILIDQRTSAACDGRVEVASERSLALKGYHDPVLARSATAVIANGEKNRTQTERA
ncbi:MAG: adenylate/guanylate cyclase domain-containing protein, partial [Acidimicrobiia bacterium]|nr:adenylate/guanylate cyclase domain-containing protein [Acidimicrobiia bacterium]